MSDNNDELPGIIIWVRELSYIRAPAFDVRPLRTDTIDDITENDYDDELPGIIWVNGWAYVKAPYLSYPRPLRADALDANPEDDDA